jgi:type IV secretory pathway VirB2 component (pilin)
VGGTLVGSWFEQASARCQLKLEPRSDKRTSMTGNSTRLVALVSAIVAAAALRLVPHPPNFTPIGAMALFSGAYLGRRWLAFAAPLAALVLSDAILGFYPGMWVQYVAVALIVLLGICALQRRSALRIAGAAVASSILFFLVTNFGTWALSGMYPATAAGLAACYVAAIPFFQNTLAGDLFYATLLFGGLRVAEHAAPRLRQGRAPQMA